MLVTKFETSILNIGLENNTCGTHKELLKRLENMDMIILAESLNVGQYLGNSEVTSVVQVITRNRLPLSIEQVEILCREFTQECIAVYEPHRGTGALIYNPNFEGKQIEFDSKFFIMPKELSIHTQLKEK